MTTTKKPEALPDPTDDAVEAFWWRVRAAQKLRQTDDTDLERTLLYRRQNLPAHLSEVVRRMKSRVTDVEAELSKTQAQLDHERRQHIHATNLANERLDVMEKSDQHVVNLHKSIEHILTNEEGEFSKVNIERFVAELDAESRILVGKLARKMEALTHGQREYEIRQHKLKLAVYETYGPEESERVDLVRKIVLAVLDAYDQDRRGVREVVESDEWKPF